MASKDIHPEDLGEFVIETKLQRSMKVKETMVEDIKGGDYGQIKGVTGTFLLISGAAKLADDFGYYAVLKDLKEEPLGEGNLKITTTLDIMDGDGKQIGSGVGTWDTTERGLPDRQRGMAISYKRAFVLGIRSPKTRTLLKEVRREKLLMYSKILKAQLTNETIKLLLELVSQILPLILMHHLHLVKKTRMEFGELQLEVNLELLGQNTRAKN